MIKLCAFSDEASNDLLGQITALKRNNISYMEIRNVNGKNVKDLTVEEAIVIKQILDDNNIKVWSVGSPIGKEDIDIDIDEYMKKVCHIFHVAKLLGAGRVRIFSFFRAYDKQYKVFDFLRRMVQKAKEYDLKLCHENEKDIYGDTLSRNLQILDNVPGLYYVYDPANFLQVGQKAEETLAALAHRADYFHIKDVISDLGQLVPAGEGDGCIEELISTIKDDKVLTLEPHLTVFQGYSDIDKTEMNTKYTFHSNDEAFDAATSALKKLLTRAGYRETKEGYVK